MPQTRAQIYRRRRLVVFAGAAALLGVGAYLPMTLFAPLDPTAAVVTEPVVPTAAAPELSWPSSTAIGVGAVGFDGVLAATGSTDVLPMASISKVVTALTVLERHPLTLDDHGPAIEMTAQDVRYFSMFQARGATVKPVSAGIALSQYELLQASLVPSAANYTQSLIIWAFGTEEQFVAAAGEWLAANGLDQTTLVEPTGLDPRNSSTVTDLVELGKIALAHPVIAEIVATPLVHLPGAGLLENSNEILGTHGIDGIKTGTLPEAGACLLFSSDFLVGERSVTIVGVALGGVLHDVQYPQIQSLVATVQAGFHEVALVTQGEPFGLYTTEWGETAAAVAAESRTALVWGDTPISATARLDPVSSADAGTRVGTATYTVADSVVEVPLVLADPLEDPGPAWRLGNPSLAFG